MRGVRVIMFRAAVQAGSGHDGVDGTVAEQVDNEDSDEEDADYDITAVERQPSYDSSDDDDDDDEDDDDGGIDRPPKSNPTNSPLLLSELNTPVPPTSQQLTLHAGSEPINRLLPAHLTRPPLHPASHTAAPHHPPPLLHRRNPLAQPCSIADLPLTPHRRGRRSTTLRSLLQPKSATSSAGPAAASASAWTVASI